MESILERQAIRTALTLAAASASASTPDAIADIREAATQLIELCVVVRERTAFFDGVRLWCDDAAALLQRVLSHEGITEKVALDTAAIVLRLRLASVRSRVALRPLQSDTASQEIKKSVSRISKNSITPMSGEENMAKIKEYISRHPHVRTNALIEALAGTFSARTVQRYLKEMCDSGVLHRTRHEDGGVSYCV